MIPARLSLRVFCSAILLGALLACGAFGLWGVWLWLDGGDTVMSLGLLGGSGVAGLGFGALWLGLRRHFHELERLRAGLLVASANVDGRLPPLPHDGGLIPRSEAASLRRAAEILIARRLFPNATTDERLRAILGAIDEGILVVTEHGQISLVNSAAKEMLGADRLHLGASAFASFERPQLLGALEQARHRAEPISWTLADMEGNHYTTKVTHLRGHSGTVIRLSPITPLNAHMMGRSATSARSKAQRPQLAVVSASSESPPLDTLVKTAKAPPELRCLTRDTAPAAEGFLESLAAPALHGAAPSEWDLSLHDQPVPDVQQLSPLLVARDTPLEDLPVLVFDTETTGLDVRSDRLVQVGGVRLHGARIFHVATIDRLINPQRPVPTQATSIHGISTLMLQDTPPFAETWPALEPLFRGAVVVGHNVGFDLAMIRRECSLAGLPFVQPPALDTVLLASLLLPAGTALTLDKVAEALGVDIHGRHTALGDALVTADVYVRLLPLLEAAGIRTYAEAYAFTRKATQLLARQHAMGW